MSVRMLRRGVLVGLLGAVCLTASCDKRKLTEVEVPDEGVQLAYDLTAGKRYDGHIRVSSTLGSPLGEIYNALEYDVELVVDPPEGDRTLVRATVTAATVDVRLPDGMPAQAGLTQKAADGAKGLEMRFYLHNRGDVSDPPPPPADADIAVKQVIGLVWVGLKGTFVRLPPGAVKQGDSWDTTPTEVADGETASGTGKLVGLARDDATGEDIARLEYSSTATRSINAGAQPVTVSLTGDATALFSKTGYVAKIERRLSGDASGMTIVYEVNAKLRPKA